MMEFEFDDRVGSPALAALLARGAELCPDQGPAHDHSHVQRVAAVAVRIATAEGADVEVVHAAALLHELFNYPKDHPDSHLSGVICAERAGVVLEEAGFDARRIPKVLDCIREHSFSRGMKPGSPESAILQDADRLDAIGAVGVARWAATCAEMGRPFHAPEDLLHTLDCIIYIHDLRS